MDTPHGVTGDPDVHAEDDDDQGEAKENVSEKDEDDGGGDHHEEVHDKVDVLLHVDQQLHKVN